MKLVLLIVVLLYQFSCLACADGPILAAGEFYLSKDEIAARRKLALGGDASASIRLAEYYSVYAGDSDSGLFWLKLAAENGNCEAVYQISYRYTSMSRTVNSGQIAYWENLARELKCPSDPMMYVDGEGRQEPPESLPKE